MRTVLARLARPSLLRGRVGVAVGLQLYGGCLHRLGLPVLRDAPLEAVRGA